MRTFVLIKVTMELLRRNGFFLSEAFFVLAGITLLCLGFNLLSLNAIATERMASLVSDGGLPRHGVEGSDASVHLLESVNFSHMANCPTAGVISELRKTGRRITLHIQLSGSVENGCDEHYVYVSSPHRIDASARGGTFSTVRVRRLDRYFDSSFDARAVPSGEWLEGTLYRLDVESDDQTYWDSNTFVDDVFWEKEHLTTSANGVVQGRISIDVSHLALEWGRPWYLPYSLAPVISKLSIALPSGSGFSLWASFTDLDYDGAERAFVGLPRGRSFRYPTVDELRNYYPSSVAKSRVSLDQPVAVVLGRAQDLSGQTAAELKVVGANESSFGDGGSGYSARASFYVSPENYEDRVATVYVLIGVILGFALALLIEVVVLILREVQRVISI